MPLLSRQNCKDKTRVNACVAGGFAIRKATGDSPRSRFFITRLKGDKDFSPTTMYKDHAKSQSIFHWESPNNTTLISEPGKRYVSDSFTKMLFIRQSKRKQMDITGSYPIGNQTSNYIFLGPVSRVLNHEGECPIGIDYELKYPIPADVYEYARGA